MSKPAQKNITITRGDTLTEIFNVKTNDGILDLTGWTVSCHVRRTKDAPVLIDLSGRIVTTPVDGIITITIEKSDTELINFSGDTLEGVYDLQLDGPDGQRHTIVEGSFILLKGVTR